MKIVLYKYFKLKIKAIFILLLTLFLNFCHHPYPRTDSYDLFGVYDDHQQFLGTPLTREDVKHGKTKYNIISPQGYPYVVYGDGTFEVSGFIIYSSSQTKLKDMFIEVVDGTKPSVYRNLAIPVVAPSGGYSDITWFCHKGDAFEPLPDNVVNLWQPTSDFYVHHIAIVSEFSYTSTASKATRVGFKLTPCPDHNAGIPDFIYGPLDIYQEDPSYDGNLKKKS